MAEDVLGVLRPASPSPQKTIIVLGAPRGGTSMVAATLRKLNVMMGEKLGHQHEDPEFRKEIPIANMVETIKQRNASHDLWGWKLPNSVYYVEELLPHLRNPHFIAVFRNPYSISCSSSERDKREYDAHLLQVAVNHTKKIVDLVMRIEAPTALISFEAAVSRPKRFARSLSEFIGVSADEEMLKTAVKDAINRELGYLRF